MLATVTMFIRSMLSDIIFLQFYLDKYESMTLPFIVSFFVNNLINDTLDWLKETGHYWLLLEMIVSIKTYSVNEQWRAVDSIKHYEKRLPLK